MRVVGAGWLKARWEVFDFTKIFIMIFQVFGKMIRGRKNIKDSGRYQLMYVEMFGLESNHIQWDNLDD